MAAQGPCFLFIWDAPVSIRAQVTSAVALFVLSVSIISAISLYPISIYGFPASTHGTDLIPLPSGPIEPSKKTTKEFLQALKTERRGPLHGIAKVSVPLTQKQRESLSTFGIYVLEPFKNSIYWVSVSQGVNLRAVKDLKLGINLVLLHDRDRVDPDIWQENYQRYRIARPGQDPYNYVLNEDGTVNLTVQFHADITATDAKGVLEKHGRILRKKSAAMWVVVIPQTSVRSLAEDDRVQWITAGPLPFLPENNHTREAINVDALQTLNLATGHIGGWNGTDVRVGIFDDGIDERHPDFDGRVGISPYATGPNHHGTQMAGIVAGHGWLSNESDSLAPGMNGSQFQWRGMAPQVLLIDASWDHGEDVSAHTSLISSPGMQLSNHSYAISFDGSYSLFDRARDGIMRGIVPNDDGTTTSIPRRLSVFSAGDLGQSSWPSYHQKGYFSLTKQLKNGLVVGWWNYWCDSQVDPSCVQTLKQIAKESSLGPAHDGRIKPDVVAPGTDIISPTLLPPDPGPPCPPYTPPCPPYYGGASGASTASAAVTGSIALVLHRYKDAYSVADLNLQAPWPSTLRAVMIHTATDVTIDDPPYPQTPSSPWFSNSDGGVKPTPGPDFVTGWGLINTEAAVNLVGGKHLLEDTIDECEAKVYSFFVGTSDPIRVTLAWDDPPYTDPYSSSTEPRLLNDLDLILIDPMGQSHYPWKLDQTILDANGSAIPDYLQSCTTPISPPKRQFTPTSTPETSNDPIPSVGPGVPSGGGVPFAVKGRDHLNNVEVVDVTAPIAGMWQAQIIGFNIPQDPQPFSLIGHDFSHIYVPPYFGCKVHHLICEGLRHAVVCKRYPWICATKFALPTREGRSQIRFGTSKDKIITPLTRVCSLFADCPPCNMELRCADYAVDVQSSKTPLHMEIYSSEGKLVKRDASTKLTKRFSFEAQPGVDYFLVFSPGKGTVIGKDYDITLRMGPHIQ
jgi:subtilisin family serine protease